MLEHMKVLAYQRRIRKELVNDLASKATGRLDQQTTGAHESPSIKAKTTVAHESPILKSKVLS